MGYDLTLSPLSAPPLSALHLAEMDQLRPANQLAEELERFEGALKNAPVVLFMQDRQLQYTWVFHAFPGFREEEILGKTDADLFTEEEAIRLTAIKQAVLESGVSRRERIRITLKDRPFFFELTISPLIVQDTLIGLTGAAVEVHELEILGADHNQIPGEVTPQANRRAELLASLARSIAETGNNFTAILNTVARLVGSEAGDACAIRVMGVGGQYLPSVLFHNDQNEQTIFTTILHQTRDEDIDFLIGPVFQQGRKLVVDDLVSEASLLSRLPEGFKDAVHQYPIHALMVLPLRTPRHMLGSMALWRSRSKQPYTPEEQSFWQEVADRSALAIENAYLYAEEVQRNQQLNALHDATTALLSTLDLEVLLGRILDAAQRAIPAGERGVLYLIAPRTGRLEIRATTGFGDPRIRRVSLLYNRHATEAMRERRPLLIRDTAAIEEDILADREVQESGEPIRSAIFAPLVLSDEVLGTLSLSSTQPGAFNNADVLLLASFAATTTAALHNAMLHTELQKIAITDPLTGLYNRRGLLELGQHEIQRCLQVNQPLSAVMLDIDHFKRVNDTYGHPVGDEVLEGLAKRCRSTIRQVDILGRYGGEEFAILLPETDLFQASTIAERLRRAVEEQPFVTEQGQVSITISLGVSRTSHNLPDLVSVIEQADAALYHAKQNGRNRIELG